MGTIPSEKSIHVIGRFLKKNRNTYLDIIYGKISRI